MAVIRVQKTDNYTIMSNEHLRNKELSLKAKGLMSLMLSLPPQWDYSIGGLVAICKESHTSIRSAIKELEENRYLIRERKNNEKGYFVYEYNLYEQQQPHTQKRHTVEKDTDNGHTVNRRQINKEELNTKELNNNRINKEKELDEILSLSVANEELKELYKDYIAVREGMEVPLTARTLKMLIARNERLSKSNIKIQKLLLENAIINEWKNIFLPSEQEINTVSQEIQGDLRELFGI